MECTTPNYPYPTRYPLALNQEVSVKDEQFTYSWIRFVLLPAPPTLGMGLWLQSADGETDIDILRDFSWDEGSDCFVGGGLPIQRFDSATEMETEMRRWGFIPEFERAIRWEQIKESAQSAATARARRETAVLPLVASQ